MEYLYILETVFEYILSQSLFDQNKTCICLSDGFDSSTNQLASSNCTYTCTRGGLLSTECGGTSAFNVFLTG